MLDPNAVGATTEIETTPLGVFYVLSANSPLKRITFDGSGTPQTPTSVLNANSTSISSQELTYALGTLYFVANDNLWRFNSTTGLGAEFYDFRPGDNLTAAPSGLVATANRLFLQSNAQVTDHAQGVMARNSG